METRSSTAASSPGASAPPFRPSPPAQGCRADWATPRDPTPPPHRHASAPDAPLPLRHPPHPPRCAPLPPRRCRKVPSPPPPPPHVAASNPRAPLPPRPPAPPRSPPPHRRHRRRCSVTRRPGASRACRARVGRPGTPRPGMRCVGPTHSVLGCPCKGPPQCRRRCPDGPGRPPPLHRGREGQLRVKGALDLILHMRHRCTTIKGQPSPPSPDASLSAGLVAPRAKRLPRWPVWRSVSAVMRAK